MKVSKGWLQELVNLKTPIEKLDKLLPLRTIATKEVTDNFIELDMKGYNRADLLSMRGVAYEVAAITNSSVTFKEKSQEFIWNKPDQKDELAVTETREDLESLNVLIQDENLCPVYCLAKIENLKVEHSDESWIKKLSDSGMRPVNNVADITNLIMLEYGQPLHAFDADKVNGQVSVRLASQGETLQTLDNKTRQLEKSDLVIADKSGPIAIAGIMGGKLTEVSNSTETILLEAAIFDPTTLRTTATKLGLQSDAAKRFYHGLTVTRLFQAFDDAIRRYENLGGRLTGIYLLYKRPGHFVNLDQAKNIPLNLTKVNQLIGVDLTREQVKEYLEKLHFKFVGEANEGHNIRWMVGRPYWRLDIEIEEDLIEEVVRLYGYEKIPPKPLEGIKPGSIDQKLFNTLFALRKALAKQGLTEIQTYSFFSTNVLGIFHYDKGQLIKIANPMSSETEYLRNHLWPNLVEVVAKNARQGFNDIAIFEIGKVYYPIRENGYEEKYRLSTALLNGSDDPTTELYQIFKEVSAQLNLKIEAGEQIGESDQRFHPVRYLYLTYQGKLVGKIGEVHPRGLNKLGVNKRVAILEIELDFLFKD